MKMWQIRNANEEGKCYLAFLALNGLAMSSMSMALTWGKDVDITVALGYAALAYFLTLIKVTYISKEVDAFDPIFKRLMNWFWTPLTAIVALSVLAK